MIDMVDQTIMTGDLKTMSPAANSSISRFSQKWMGGKSAEENMIMVGALSLSDSSTLVS